MVSDDHRFRLDGCAGAEGAGHTGGALSHLCGCRASDLAVLQGIQSDADAEIAHSECLGGLLFPKVIN